MLHISELEVAYGDVQVLWGIDIHVSPGETVALVGSNGSGKSTLLRTISGLVRPRRGVIRLGDQDIAHRAAQDVVRLGVAHVPEGRRLFYGLSVLDNLAMGAYLRNDKEAIRRDLARVYKYFPRLEERQTQLAGKLSGGEQQMCAIGRALMSHPKLLLIDELSLGLAPVVVDDLIVVLEEMKAEGMTIVLVEQDVETALGLADCGYVLENGRISAEGMSSQLLADDHVRSAYLGL